MVTIVLPCLMNSTPCPLPPIPSSQRPICAFRASELSFPDLFLSPLSLERSVINLRLYLDAASSLSPLFAALTENTRGWGSHPSNKRVRNFPAAATDRGSRNTDHSSGFKLATHHSSFAPNSSRIRTYERRDRKPFGIRTSKTKHLKPFRMNTYKKTGGRGHLK